MREMIQLRAKQSQPCSACGHERNQHSREKCTWPGCSCTRTYMEVGEENRR